MPKFLVPDKTVWPDSDPRKTIDKFDEVFYRDHYNKRMSIEQPMIPYGQCTASSYDKFIISMIAEQPSLSKNILDIGCGNARTSLYMVINNIVDTLVGIDISDVMVERATETARLYNISDKAKFIRSTIEDFVPEEQFNGIYATEIIEHIFNLHDTLAKIALWLTDDGVFCGAVPHLNTCDSAPVHFHYFTVDTLTLLLQDFFNDVLVTKIDINGKLEFHLVFKCLKPKRG